MSLVKFKKCRCLSESLLMFTKKYKHQMGQVFISLEPLSVSYFKETMKSHIIRLFDKPKIGLRELAS